MTNHPRVDRDHRTTASPCPDCGRELDGAWGHGQAPVAGDAGVCAYCAGIHLYTEDGIRAPTDGERAALLAIPAIYDTVFKLRQFIETRSSGP